MGSESRDCRGGPTGSLGSQRGLFGTLRPMGSGAHGAQDSQGPGDFIANFLTSRGVLRVPLYFNGAPGAPGFKKKWPRSVNDFRNFYLSIFPLFLNGKLKVSIKKWGV